MNGMKQILKKMMRPVLDNGRVFFAIWFTCVAIVVFGNLYLNHAHESVFVTFLCVAFDAYLICLLLWMTPRRLKPFLRLLVYFLLYMGALVEFFLIFNYKTFIRPFAVMLFMETDGRESSEFLSSIWKLPGTYYAILLTCVMVLCSIALYPLCRRSFVSRRRWGIYVLFVLIAWSATREVKNYIRVVSSLGYSNATAFEFGQVEAHYYSPFTRLLGGFVYYRLLSNEYAMLDKTVAATEVDGCRFVSPVIVLIIGESYNKHHSPLYNPKSLNTTPHLCELAKDSALYVFKDVVAVSNRTTDVFRNIFSMDKEVGGNVKYTLFPAIFKKAGYDVAFISNQFIMNARLDKHDVCGGAMFNYGDLSKNQFTHRNETQYEFDHELLQVYDTMRIRKDGPMLAIFHLLGQHMTYDLRYPESYAYFTEDSVSLPYGNAARRIAADYENATRYNDEVVYSIIKRFMDKEAIVIYMSDHGEQVYDGIDYWGRSYETPMLQATAKYQHEVPFLVYMSPLYKERHPDISELIVKGTMRPFLTSDLPHVLLFLAGISHKDYDEQRNLFSPHYNAKRKRLLRGDIDYDELIGSQNL